MAARSVSRRQVIDPTPAARPQRQRTPRAHEHGFQARSSTPLQPNERDAISARQQRWEAERAVEFRASKLASDARKAEAAIRDQFKKERTDSMARAHRERQMALQYTSLRERRLRQERKMDDAEDRRQAYLNRFVSPRKGI